MEEQKVLDEIALIINVEELDLNKIRYCMQCEDFLIRCDTIEILSRFAYSKDIEKIITEAIYDKNYLVRCEAYEALEKTENSQTIIMLYERIKKDRSSTARMYAVSAILGLIKRFGYVDDIVEKLRISYAKEKIKRVNLAYLALFYYVEQKIEYINKILSYLDDEDYHIRCNVINILSEVIDDKNISIVKNAYKKRYVVESTMAVKSTLEKYV